MKSEPLSKSNPRFLEVPGFHNRSRNIPQRVPTPLRKKNVAQDRMSRHSDATEDRPKRLGPDMNEPRETQRRIRDTSADITKFRNLAFRLSMDREFYHRAERLLQSYSYGGSIWPVEPLSDNKAPLTYEHYRIDKELKNSGSWAKVKITRLDTSQYKLAMLTRSQSSEWVMNCLQRMSRARRSSIYDLLAQKNAEDRVVSFPWHLARAEIIESKIRQSEDGATTLDVITMEVVISKREGYVDGRPTEDDNSPPRSPEYDYSSEAELWGSDGGKGF